MHLHTDEKEAEKEAVKVDYLLSTYLPYGYVKDAQEKLKSENRGKLLLLRRILVGQNLQN